MTNARILLLATLYLFGTFLHELAHVLAGTALGTPTGFSLVPRRQGDRITFGSASVRVKYKVFAAAVAAAPLLWWAVLYFAFIRQSRLIHITLTTFRIDTALLIERALHPALSDILALWLFAQLLWAGTPSKADMKAFARGLCSPSGVLALTMLAAALLAARRLLR